MKFLYRFHWYRVYRMCEYVRKFGPDQVSIISTDMSGADMIKKALQGWYGQIHTLLPKRYKRLIEKLFKEAAITAEVYTYHVQIGPLLLFLRASRKLLDSPVRLNGDSELLFAWEKEPDWLHHATPELRGQVASFEADFKNVERFIQETFYADLLCCEKK